MNRRGFLRAALGATVGVVAGAELIEALAPTRTIFLPPAGGWYDGYNAGIPTFLLNYVDPKMIDVLVHPLKYNALVRKLGETDAQFRERIRLRSVITIDYDPLLVHEKGKWTLQRA